MKLRRVVSFDEKQLLGYSFECPGCENWHVIYTEPNPRGIQWRFNGDLERPTFEPSVISRWSYGEPPQERICHFFLREGRLEFLGDCTHRLAGQTVELPEKSDGG